MNAKNHDLQIGYDRVAKEYSKLIFDELEHKPIDRKLLNQFAELVKEKGPVCDMGCGPGQIARYLYDQGVANVFGMDLSPGMVAEAQRLNPDISFRPGNMLALPDLDGSWTGIAAFYSIIHIPRDEVVAALKEMERVLQPDGWLLLTFHVGDKVLHVDEWWGQKVYIDFIFFSLAEMESYLHAAGFTIVDVITRPPYPNVEADTDRAYIFAQKRKRP